MRLNVWLCPTKGLKRERVGSGWVPGDTVNTAIGQGFLLVTPLQMATFIASIARDETRTQPTLRALSYVEAQQINHGGEPVGLTRNQRVELWEGMERVVGDEELRGGSCRLMAFVLQARQAPPTSVRMVRKSI